MTNMTVGPSLAVGGNVVEMTTKGKIQVTNQQGKVKTLSQDEFKKQLVKNADKIENGEDFEFKSEHKGLKIAGVVATAAALTTAVIYRKEIGKYMKDFSFSKLGKDIKKLFTSAKNKVAGWFGKSEKKVSNVFDGSKARQVGAEGQRVANETLNLKNQIHAQMGRNTVDDFDEMLRRTTGGSHAAKQKMYERLFKPSV